MKILISSRSFGKVGSSAIDLLKDNNLEPNLNPFGRGLSEEEIISLVDEETVGIIAGTEKITRNIIEATPRLKVISRYGIGIDNIDLECARENGILIKNTPDAPTQAVAELTLALILNLLRKIPLGDRMIRNDHWEQNMGNVLQGKRVGVIGLGRIGRRVITLLQPFGVETFARELNPDLEYIEEKEIRLVELSELLKKSDVITLHVPLTPNTKSIIDERALGLMKENAIIVNTARGGLINEMALYEAVKERKIGGAAIDVYEKEPYTGKLKELDNIILSPHVGSLTEETRLQMELETVENLIAGLKEAQLI